MAETLNGAILLYALTVCAYLAGYVLRKVRVDAAGYGICLAGFVLHTAAIVMRWAAASRPPFVNLYESLVFFAWAVVLVFVVFGRSASTRYLGIFAASFASVALCYASTLDSTVKPLMPALRSNWLFIHVSSYFIGYGAAAAAFVSSAIYLCLPFAPPQARSHARRLEETTDRLVVLAFPFLTLGITTGSVWAHIAWGRYWGWDPKETWSLITWIIYALYLHIYRRKRWGWKPAAVLAVLGFVAILFTFLGVTLFLKGRHSYA